ncbi:Putative GTP-binding protein [Heterostelium album PN500]|uniref:GTP-binding protein n=1 Tax=Heterostelium pallidum (strain ATCC 26659 / Pp 5 / PN500) TaxID=670386 RepID=D3BJU1_HETP5|nr:Putative GTP-binding protein [Heterostelium album PN500]EFA78171.1 Putative GTP-binding protein [Heterostelium album PN500]|eukprot:XP_020430297.1 Putative GTP-binding protein [Heterostelium album PN500]
MLTSSLKSINSLHSLNRININSSIGGSSYSYGFTNIFSNSVDNSLFQQNKCYYVSKVERELQKQKQQRYKAMMKQRAEILENTDIDAIPKSDIVFDKKVPRLELMIGQKQTNVIKESARSLWHKRQKDNNNNSKDDEVDQQGKNAQFKQTKFEQNVLKTIEERNVGKIKISKPARGKTKLDVLRDRSKFKLPTYFHSKFVYVASAKSKESFIPEKLPEVAFIGRSNVGKSSIINAITQRGQAKTSDKPGFTQSINWYELGSTLYIVDLPGYGFAFAKSQKVDQWNQLTLEYLTTRKSLKRVFLLLDARHGLKESDHEILEILDKEHVKTQIVLTKGDLVEQKEIAKRFTLVTEELKKYHHTQLPVISVSSKTFGGIPELASLIKGFKLRKKPEVIKPTQAPVEKSQVKKPKSTTSSTKKKELVASKKKATISPEIQKYIKK